MKYYSWNPWHGCKKISPGCKNCFVYLFDSKRKQFPKEIKKNQTQFYNPIKKDKKGEFKIPSNVQLGTCFTSDFFLEEADIWREEAWEMIHMRYDIDFLIPTKRIHRFLECIPSNWEEGYDNVFICVSVENQEMADKRIPILLNLPIKKKGLFLAPLLENIDLSKYLATKQISYVSVGGESYINARTCDFKWVCSIKEQCEKYGVMFSFHQTGSNFVVNGKRYSIPHNKEFEQAKKAFKE